MEASNQFEAGIALGMATFASLDKRGQKWRTRNVPAYIREQLWRPYYITARQGGQELFIIRPPDAQNQRVHFARWPPPELHEK